MSGIREEDQKDVQASAHRTELGPYSLGVHSGPALGTNSHFWNLYEVNQLGLIVPNVKEQGGPQGLVKSTALFLASKQKASCL